MLLRLALLAVTVLGLLAIERSADACCAGCPCTKYRRQTVVVDEHVLGYTHSAAGGIPRWSMARITAFLTTGTWQPIRTLQLPIAQKPGTFVMTRAAVPLRFIRPDASTAARSKFRIVMIRRIEKHGSVILVEVDDATYKLAPCADKKRATCLLDPGDLVLDPIPPPGDATPPSDGGFAQPPP